MKIIDIHAHVNSAFYKDNLEEVLQRAKDNEIGVVNIGTNLEDSTENVAIASGREGVWASVGMHPTELGEFDYEAFKSLAKRDEVIAIGECGFDYFREGNRSDEDKMRQRRIFEGQIRIAKEVNKPLMLHLRTVEAYDDALDMIEAEIDLPPVIFHFYSANIEQTKRIVELPNAYISTGGLITFARDYDEVLKLVPLEKIMLETDSPFVTPEPHRGATNEPSFIVQVPKKLAEIKDVSEEEVLKAALDNTKRVFGI